MTTKANQEATIETKAQQNDGDFDAMVRLAEDKLAKFITDRQQLEQLYENIGQVLRATAAVGSDPRNFSARSNQQSGRQTRGANEQTIKATEIIIQFLRDKPHGYSRGEIATRCDLDTSIVQRVLHTLQENGQAKMVGERRSALWYPTGVVANQAANGAAAVIPAPQHHS